MKNKPVFIQIITLIILAVVCFSFTIAAAVLAGSLNAELFDFENFNFSNMIPVLLIGIFISCVIIGVCSMFVIRSVFCKAKDYLKENQKNNKKGDTKK